MGLPLSILQDFAANGMYPIGEHAPVVKNSVVVAVCPSYNNAYPTGRNGRRYLSKAAVAWNKDNLKILGELPKADPSRPVIITYTILEKVNPRRDGSGLEKLLVDGMVKEGVIKDDTVVYVSGEVWRYRPEEGGKGVRVEWEYDPDPPKLDVKKTRKKKRGKPPPKGGGVVTPGIHR
jgi:hypothetical protein